MTEEDLTKLNLDIYDNGHGPWNPDHDEITVPDDWDFLPTGDAFLTRSVTAEGTFWVVWRPRGRNRPHRRRLGLWAPVDAINRARQKAEETTTKRVRGREQGAKQRARAEDRYREQLATAIVTYLDFGEAHRDLVVQIAQGAAEQAARVGSGRVGRTRTLPIEERAALAARAWIRHRFTDYEDRLEGLFGDDLLVDELEYRDVKSAANQDVDDFIEARRNAPPSNL